MINPFRKKSADFVAALLLGFPLLAMAGSQHLSSLRNSVSASENAAAASTGEAAQTQALTSFESIPMVAPVSVPASAGSGGTAAPLALKGAASNALTASLPPPPPFPVSAILGRKPGEEPRSLGRSAGRAVKMGAGAVVGLVIGAPVGAVAGGYLAATVKNPALRPWRPVLFLPAVAVGAVAGLLVMPVVGAKWMKNAKSDHPPRAP